MTETMHKTGFKSRGQFSCQTRHLPGVNPNVFKPGGKGETIQFALGECTLGSFLIASTGIGICKIALGDSPEELLQEFNNQFCKATLIAGDSSIEQHIALVVEYVESPSTGLTLPLDIRGTTFQARVWEELRKTQPGQTLTYSELAERVGCSKGARAVASACAKNNIALAIPCHRVVRTDDSPSGYRWGLERKQTLLSREGNGSTAQKHKKTK